MFALIKNSKINLPRLYCTAKQPHRHQNYPLRCHHSYLELMDMDFYSSFSSILERGERLEKTTNIKDKKEVRSKIQQLFTQTLTKMKEDKFLPNEEFISTNERPLHLAVSKSFLVTSALIKVGASVNILNRFNETPLILASHENNIEAVRILIDEGASVLQPCCFRGISASPLHVTSNNEMLKLLIKNGSLVNSTSKILFAFTALHYNALCLKPENVEYLLEKGAVDWPNAQGNTALDIAKNRRDYYLKQLKKSTPTPFNSELLLDAVKIVRLLESHHQTRAPILL